jgi:hypothetical protein
VRFNLLPSRMAGDADFELLAASLRADTRDLAVFVDALASKLEAALPQRTRVSRRSRGLFSGRKQVARIEVELGEERYVLRHDGGALEARRARVVGGVVLKSEQLGLEDWVESLARAIAAEARTSEHGRLALERLIGVSPGG